MSDETRELPYHNKQQTSMATSWPIKFHTAAKSGVKRKSNNQGFQSGPVPGTFTRLRPCIVPAEITELPKISGGQNHKYDGR
jgi:hypothetical protein